MNNPSPPVSSSEPNACGRAGADIDVGRDQGGDAGQRGKSVADPDRGVTATGHPPVNRWDNPFDPAMSERDFKRIRQLPLFREMDPLSFPLHAPLDRIIRNDTRLIRYGAGELVVRKGDYGNSAFLVLGGEMAVILPPGLPQALLGQQSPLRKSAWEIIRDLLRGITFPEMRPNWQRVDPLHAREDDPTQASPDEKLQGRKKRSVRGASKARPASRARQAGTLRATYETRADGQVRTRFEDAETVLAEMKTVPLKAGEMFGEIGALGRFPRQVSVVARSASRLVEIRWQGLRDLRRYDRPFRERLDALYRERSLSVFLGEQPLFRDLPEDVFEKIVAAASLHTYGEESWTLSEAERAALSPSERVASEPLIVAEQRPADHLVLVQSGFVRISQHQGRGHRTVGFMGPGRIFGLPEVKRYIQSRQSVHFPFSLRAVGYVQVLFIPAQVLAEQLGDGMAQETPAPAQSASPGQPASAASPVATPSSPPAAPPAAPPSQSTTQEATRNLIEVLVDRRLINGTAAMMVDLGRCVRCDACLNACALVHEGNPRFRRTGEPFDLFMVARACMHCVDPVCMVGCPTGAIHRLEGGGEVVINDRTCIGCGTCASSCPYDAIVLVPIRDATGTVIHRQERGEALVQATKCDLCVRHPGGPACARACPHHALIRADMRDTRTLRRWMAR